VKQHLKQSSPMGGRHWRSVTIPAYFDHSAEIIREILFYSPRAAFSFTSVPHRLCLADVWVAWPQQMMFMTLRYHISASRDLPQRDCSQEPVYV
jgi:hypothetical protein